MGPGMGASDAGESSEASGSMLSTSAAEAALSREIDVSIINPVSIAYFIWCAGALFIFCVTIGVYAKLRKLRIRSYDTESQAALDVLSRLRERLGIRRTATKVSRKALAAVLLIGCLSLPIIGGIELVRFAGARPASNAGQIVFCRSKENEAPGIWVMDADGRNERQLTSGFAPVWLPQNFTEGTQRNPDLWLRR